MIILSICIVLGVVAMVAGVIMWAWAEMLLDRIYQEMSSTGAKPNTKCCVKGKVLCVPGFAQILDNNLIIRDVAGHRHTLPLEAVTIKKDHTVWFPPWFGKRVFRLQTPHIKHLSLGVSKKDTATWDTLPEKVLKSATEDS